MVPSPFDAWISADAEVTDLLAQEWRRQTTTLQLIASENFTSPAVMAATGSVLTNKYSEGYPGRRYYGGNQIVDEVEDLARRRLTALFGADHANVQPHSGANANVAVYQALLQPGDTILAMRLDQGGHLTHGSPASITSKIWNFVSYGVTPRSDDPANPGEVIDIDNLRELALRERPKLIVAQFGARPRIWPTTSTGAPADISACPPTGPANASPGLAPDACKRASSASSLIVATSTLGRSWAIISRSSQVAAPERSE